MTDRAEPNIVWCYFLIRQKPGQAKRRCQQLCGRDVAVVADQVVTASLVHILPGLVKTKVGKMLGKGYPGALPLRTNQVLRQNNIEKFYCNMDMDLEGHRAMPLRNLKANVMIRHVSVWVGNVSPLFAPKQILVTEKT